MVGRIVLILLLAAVAQTWGATEVQGAEIKGTVILNGENGPGVANLQINDSAHTGGPWGSESDGGFTRDYPKRAPGERVHLRVIKEGYVPVNWVQLDLDLPKDPDANPLLIIICREAEFDQANRTEGTRGAELLAQAVTAYRSALEVYTREQLPQHWAATQTNLGAALLCQALRTDWAKGSELLTQAVNAYRSALEVRTREQLPQGWAQTQNDLGLALYFLGCRSEGAEATKVFGQAVTAYRDALEVCTREQQPEQWAEVQESLGHALTEQAKRTNGKEGTKEIVEAVAILKGALTVTAHERSPKVWALNQEGLGVALTQQGIRSEGAETVELLGQAAAAFRSCLEVFTTNAFSVLPRTNGETIEGMRKAAYTG